MWRHIIFLIALSAGAIGLSLVLVPRDQEIALMLYKDEQFESALKRFEHQYFENPGNTALLLPLHDLYLREGMVDDAVAVVRRAVAVRPGDVESLQLALNLYHETYEHDAWREALQARALLTRNAEDVRIAADQHQFDARPEAEVEMRALLLDSGTGTEADFIRVVELLASLDRTDEAAARIRQRLATVGATDNPQQAELLVSVLLHAGDPEGASRALLAWLDRRSTGADMLTAAAWLEGLDNPVALVGTMGNVLADRYRSDGEWLETVEALVELPGGPRLVGAAIDVAVGEQPASGAPDVPLPEVETADRADDGGLDGDGIPEEFGEDEAPGVTAATGVQWSASAYLDWFEFALAADLPARAARLLGNAPTGAARSALLAIAAERVADHPLGMVGMLLDALPPDLEPSDTLGAAEIALAGGKLPRAIPMLERTDADDLTGAARIRLANAWLKVGQIDRAVPLLDRIAVTDARTVREQVALAGVYRAANRADEGLAALGPSLRSSGNVAAVEAWALLAVAAGRSDPVVTWLDGLPAGARLGLGKDFLLALADTATATTARDVEQRALRLLRGAANDQAGALALADALGRAGRWREALGTLDAFRTSEDARDRGDTLLLAARGRSDDAEVRAALTARLEERVRTDGLQSPTVTRLVNDLLAADADQVALTTLAALAGTVPAEWYERFRESALRIEAFASLASVATGLLENGPRQSEAGDAPGPAAVARLTPDLEQRLLGDLALGAGAERALALLAARLQSLPAGSERAMSLLYAGAELARGGAEQSLVAVIDTRLAAAASANERSALSALATEAGGLEAALPVLRREALRDDLGEAEESAAWFAWRNAAIAAGQHADVADVLRTRLRASKRDSERRQRLLFDLGEVAGKEALIAWLAMEAGAPGLTRAERSERFDALRDAGLAAGDLSAAIEVAEARVEAATNPDDALAWLDALASMGVGTVAAAERWLTDSASVDRADNALYYRFRDAALAEGAVERLLTFIERQLSAGHQRGLFTSELIAYAPPQRALAVLRREATPTDTVVTADTAPDVASGKPSSAPSGKDPDLQLEEAYYAYQSAALSLDARAADGSRIGRDDFIAFITEGLARDDLSLEVRQLYEYDLGRLGDPDVLLAYLASRAGRDALPASERERAYSVFVGAVTATASQQRFAEWVAQRLENQPGDPLALRYLDDLIATAGPAAAIPALEARVRQPDIDIAARAEAYFRLRQAALAANQGDRLAAFVEERLRSGDRSGAWSSELQTLAGNEAALPWLEAEAETEHRAGGTATTAYYRLREAALAARRPAVFVGFLAARLDEISPDHPRLDLYEYDFTGLAGTAAVLGYLETRAVRSGIDGAMNVAYYERFREAAREANALDRVVAFVETRLAELEQGASEADAAGRLEYFLDELAAVTAPEKAADRFEARARDAALTDAQRAAAYYRLRALAEGAGLEPRLVAFLRERLQVEFGEPWVSEFRAVAGDSDALPDLQFHAERADLDDEQRELAYYAFQASAQAAGRVEAFVAFLAGRLAEVELSAPLRALYEYDLERFAERSVAFDHFMRQLARTDLGTDERSAYLSRARDLALAGGADDALAGRLGRELRALADDEPTGPLASLMLKGVAAAEGPAAVLDALRDRALDTALGLEARAAAYDEFKQAATDAGRLDMLTAFVREQLASEEPAVRDIYLLELRLVAGDEQALPWLEKEAGRDDLGVERARGAYYAFAETAVNSANTERLIDFLDQRLDTLAVTHALRETYIYELQRLGGPSAVLPHLRRAVETPESPEEVRLSAYYVYRAASEEAGEMGTYLDAIGDWLAAGLGTAKEHDAWLYDLRQIGGPERVLPWLRREAIAAEGTAGDGTAETDTRDAGASYYAFADAARAANSPAVLVDFLVERLATASLPAAMEKLYVDALVTEAEPEVALRALRGRAEGDPQTWGPAYAELLRRTGRTEELVAYALGNGLDPNLPAGIRQGFADLLLNAGRKAQAVQVLQPLASAAGPDAEVTDYLMYLLGPRPGATVVDWLTGIAGRAGAEDRIGWATRLQSIGATQRAVALLRPTDGIWPSPLALQAYVDALAVARDRAELATFLDRFVASPLSTAMLRWAGGVAEDAGLEPQASNAWRELIRRRPKDLDALRRLGFLAYAKGRRQEAERTLRVVLERVDEDYEGHFFYGELLFARGLELRAQQHYRRSLNLIESNAEPDFRQRTVRAQSLQRLGRTEAALAAFRRLVAERPREGHLRADYVNMLLDNRRTGLARQALGNAGGRRP